MARPGEPDLLTQVGTRARPLLAGLLWSGLQPFRGTLERSRDGEDLRPGITAVISARNEDYTIPFCLRSLVGVVDQVVCIDNGSDDTTLTEMERFREEHGDEIDVEIASMPGALLGDCRNEGLRRTRHQWHLRWDADMVATTSGPDSILEVTGRALADDRPRTIQLARTNLFGDLWHTQRLTDVIEPGEGFLMRFGKHVRYQEFGRFDAVRVPFYYQQAREPTSHIFHLAGLKSAENLIHRFHYFTWRETVNREGAALDSERRTLEGFIRQTNLELFGTNDPRSVKFRYLRQAAYHLVRYDSDRYGAYPEVLEAELDGPQRFEVLYRDGRPWMRVDHEDDEMAGYEPTEEDLAWDPEEFLRRFLTDNQCAELDVAPR
jgi:glycosyltransferase involved in cell wall biosynthesis